MRSACYTLGQAVMPAAWERHSRASAHATRCARRRRQVCTPAPPAEPDAGAVVMVEAPPQPTWATHSCGGKDAPQRSGRRSGHMQKRGLRLHVAELRPRELDVHGVPELWRPHSLQNRLWRRVGPRRTGVRSAAVSGGSGTSRWSERTRLPCPACPEPVAPQTQRTGRVARPLAGATGRYRWAGVLHGGGQQGGQLPHTTRPPASPPHMFSHFTHLDLEPAIHSR